MCSWVQGHTFYVVIGVDYFILPLTTSTCPWNVPFAYFTCLLTAISSERSAHTVWTIQCQLAKQNIALVWDAEKAYFANIWMPSMICTISWCDWQ